MTEKLFIGTLRIIQLTSLETKVLGSSYACGTIKFLNFRMPEIFSVIYLKFKQRGQILRVFCQNGANGIANSGDPDQNAPLGQSDLGLHCLPRPICPKT